MKTKRSAFRLAWLPATILLAISGFGLRAEAQSGGDWTRALPGWVYQFPRDHAAHPDFKTEWWYFTGNVRAEDGHAYGYELTFFRQGLLPPGQRARQISSGGGRSRFVQDDFKFAHFAITDLTGHEFQYTERMSRGAFGEAGAAPVAVGAGHPFVWLENWTLTAQADGSWRIVAKADEPVPMAIDLQVSPLKGPVIEGTDGVSQKSEGAGNASHYYSFTRLATVGTLTVGTGKRASSVRGESWFDHEWASNQLGPEQIGWNWFCLQLSDQTEVMLYAMRRRDGSVDPVSSGTYIDARGESTHLKREDFQLQPLETWRSAKTGANYPLGWRVAIPSQGIDATVRARLNTQELALPQISYWEGATELHGTRFGHPLGGQGYMELTGYTGALVGLQHAGNKAQTGLRTPPR